MPYIIVQCWYPTEVNVEVTEKYFEILKEFPFDKSLGKETIPVSSNTNKNGVEIISIMEVKQGKLEEAWKWVGKRMGGFQEIKGFEYEYRLWSTLVEALEGTDYAKLVTE
jgi:hypothetical protein